jgi:hypothetical protein
MIEIGKTLVSEELFKRKFVCDLNACKGACCVEGDSGAPLEKEEMQFLDADYEKIKPFMRAEGIAAVEAQGKYVVDPYDGDDVTPLVNNRECAYVSFNEQGVALCAIEQAHAAGKTKFKKPISCHLYPVRTKKYRSFEAVNYDEWDICAPACACGDKLDVPVFKFAKDALIRKYGQDWYDELGEVYKAYVDSQTPKK